MLNWHNYIVVRSLIMTMNDERDKIKTLYDRKSVAEEYIRIRFAKPLGAVQHRIQVRAVNQTIRNYKARNILEIACGPARLTTEITGFETGVAIDNSDEMLSIAEDRVSNNKQWKFLNGDAFNLEIDEKFHLIYSFRFIRHFELKDRRRLYSNVSDLLSKSGIFLFDAVHYEKHKCIKYFEKKGDIQIYDKIYLTQHELITELDRAGFEVLEIKEVVRHFYIQAVISRAAHILRLNAMGERIIAMLENLKFGRPLEWIIICRKR